MHSCAWTRRSVFGPAARNVALWCALVAIACAGGAGCRTEVEKQSVRARTLRDVPAERLSYRFETDVTQPPVTSSEEQTKLAAVQKDFETRRKDDALIRTVVSPDGQRALALYATADDPNSSAFRIDMYAADGNFLRNLLPPDLSGAFPQTVAWSPDGSRIAFIASRNSKPKPMLTPPDILPVETTGATPSPNASVAPIFAPVPAFDTEQVYVCNRDGFDLKPLTTREGLIYFHVAWAPDAHALVALACTEDEWNAREKEHKLPAGRPRLIGLDGKERLLDDGLTDALPVWSPDSSKVATAFETDAAIYDAATETPTGARISLHDSLLAASIEYDEKNLHVKTKSPVSLNPIIQLLWTEDKTLYVQTGFARTYENEPPVKYPRWHTLHLSPQAAALGSN